MACCEHGIFLAREDERRSGFAWYCSTCRPLGWAQSYHYGAMGGDSRKMDFALRYQSSPRSVRLTANRHERKGNACPNCDSSYRYQIEGSTKVACSECGTIWKPIRRGDSLELEGAAA